MEISNTKKLNAYKAILPMIERDNWQPICECLKEYFKKTLKEIEAHNIVYKGVTFSEIKVELINQNEKHFFKSHTRVAFIKKQIQYLQTNKNK